MSSYIILDEYSRFIDSTMIDSDIHWKNALLTGAFGYLSGMSIIENHFSGSQIEFNKMLTSRNRAEFLYLTARGESTLHLAAEHISIMSRKNTWKHFQEEAVDHRNVEPAKTAISQSLQNIFQRKQRSPMTYYLQE